MAENPPDKTDLASAVTVAESADISGDDTLAGAHPNASAAALEDTVAGSADSAGASASTPQVTIPVQGDALGRYVVDEPLGAGGMGVVYRGFDPDLQRPVALKLLSPRAGARSASGSDSARARLMREAQAMARLSHPNILTVHDVGVWGEQVYIAMELVAGATLQEWLRAEPRSVESILEVFVQAAEGLQAAHSAELVHRDFKPDNVLLDQGGRVRVMDFGLARHSADPAERSTPPSDTASRTPLASDSGSALRTPLTQVGALLGTPAYMSPEQYAGADVDARSDQFAFGVALYEALYQRRPFGGKTLEELREAVTAGRVSPPPDERPVAVWLQEIVARTLATDPGDRFGSMAELVVAIERWRRRRKRLAWGLGGAVALLVALGAVLFFQHRSAASDAEQRRASKRARTKQAALASAQRDRDRLKHHLNVLRAKRAALLKQLVVEKDALKRHSLACRIAGLEDIIKTPGERITAKEIRRALNHCLPMVKHCYLATLKKHPRVAGTIQVEFLTDRDGKVTRVRFPVDTVKVPMLTRCIFDTFSRWHFPTGGGDIEPLRVAYPFRFKSKK